MSLNLEVSGVEYENFTNASVEFSMLNFSRSFNFAAVSTEDNPFPFSGGESCKVLINGETVLDGFIERIEVSYSGNSHAISISGRDKMGDLVDSTLETLDIQADISLEDVIRRVLKALKFSGITVTNEVSDLTDFKKNVDIESPSTGQNAWDFIEKLARKKQVLLRTDNNANILIQRSSTQQNPTSLINRLNDSRNNILSSSASFDLTPVYNLYRVRSQDNSITANLGGKTTAEELVNKSGDVTVTGIRQTRQLVIQAESASPNQDAKDRATWEANFRQSQQKVYSATVDGFTDIFGNLWNVNQLVAVDDDFANINARMLVESLVFSVNLSDGEQTTLNLVPKDSYKLELQQTEFEKTDNVGGAFS